MLFFKILNLLWIIDFGSCNFLICLQGIFKELLDVYYFLKVDFDIFLLLTNFKCLYLFVCWDDAFGICFDTAHQTSPLVILPIGARSANFNKTVWWPINLIIWLIWKEKISGLLLPSICFCSKVLSLIWLPVDGGLIYFNCGWLYREWFLWLFLVDDCWFSWLLNWVELLRVALQNFVLFLVWAGAHVLLKREFYIWLLLGLWELHSDLFNSWFLRA